MANVKMRIEAVRIKFIARLLANNNQANFAFVAKGRPLNQERFRDGTRTLGSHRLFDTI